MPAYNTLSDSQKALFKKARKRKNLSGFWVYRLFSDELYDNLS